MRVRGRLTYSNVVATIALFGVLAGGGAYAASKIGPNDIKKGAVQSKHIKKAAVKGGKLAPDAVAGDKVLDGSLTSSDIANGTLTGYKIANGSVFGINLAPGQITTSHITNGTISSLDLGSSSVTGDELGPVVRRSNSFTIPALGTSSGSVSCGAGEQLLAGGGLTSTTTTTFLIHSYPASSTTWTIRAGSTTGNPATATVYALCLDN